MRARSTRLIALLALLLTSACASTSLKDALHPHFLGGKDAEAWIDRRVGNMLAVYHPGLEPHRSRRPCHDGGGELPLEDDLVADYAIRFKRYHHNSGAIAPTSTSSSAHVPFQPACCHVMVAPYAPSAPPVKFVTM